MGRAEREKGARAEREFARRIGGRRVPLSGAAGGEFAGDVIGLGLRWELKVRKDGFQQLYSWLDGKDALAIRADRKGWLVVMPLDQFMAMLEGEGERGSRRQGSCGPGQETATEESHTSGDRGARG